MADFDKTGAIDDSPRPRVVTGSLRSEQTVRTAAPGAVPRALTLTAMSGNTYGQSADLTRELGLFEIRSVDDGLDMRLPLNISLVIDRSASMQGGPLEAAKRACTEVVEMLEPQDILSVITFEDRADVVMPARRVINKALVKDYISRIHAGNGTNLYEGLMTAFQQVGSVKSENTLNRILLLTDGEPTAGTQDFAVITGLVSEQKGRGITVTTLGFGSDFNEELLVGIARRSGGNYYYLPRPELIPEAFHQELETLMRITARNLRLRLHLPRGVTIRQVYGQQPVYGNRTAEVSLIDVARGTGLMSLWELEISPRPAGTYRIARAELLYDDAGTGRPEKVSADLVMDFTTDRPLIDAGENSRVEQELGIARAARALDKTAMAVQTQQMDVTHAMQELSQTKTLMVSQDRRAQAEEITQVMQQIAAGDSVEKTLTGAVHRMDQGRRE
jgi:Ca-activated chloride channel family protein